MKALLHYNAMISRFYLVTHAGEYVSPAFFSRPDALTWMMSNGWAMRGGEYVKD